LTRDQAAALIAKAEAFHVVATLDLRSGDACALSEKGKESDVFAWINLVPTRVQMIEFSGPAWAAKAA
jgi:hypothetical protein